MITFLSLLLVASFADEQFTEPEQERTHMAPAEGLAVVFYSKEFRFTKIADPGQDNAKVWADQADASSRNLFVLDKDQGDYFIRDATSNRRLGCAENTNIYAVPSDSTIWPDQLWKFRGPDSDGFYEIVNVHRPKYQIGLMSSSSVGCWDTTWSDGKYWKWRLEDIFTATALWKSIAELDNDSDVDGNYQYKKTVGYTQSITQSEAHKSSVSQSLEFSAGGALKGIDLGATSTTTMTEEFSSSVSNSMSGTFTTTETLTWPVPAGKCLQILQVQVKQDDTMKDIQDMTFYSTKTKIQNCPGSDETSVAGGRSAGLRTRMAHKKTTETGVAGGRSAGLRTRMAHKKTTENAIGGSRSFMGNCYDATGELESGACDSRDSYKSSSTHCYKCKRGWRRTKVLGFIDQDYCCTNKDMEHYGDCMCPPESSAEKAVGCPTFRCMMYCPNGFEKDANGCETCSCARAEMTMALATPESTGPHWAVKVLAFVGFAASVYGAACHYTKPKEQVTL